MDEEQWIEMEKLVEELVDFQHGKVMQCGRRVIPHLTTDDLLQPNDFPELENHPYFRYEEGVLAGIQTVQMTLRAWKKRRKIEEKEQDGQDRAR